MTEGVNPYFWKHPFAYLMVERQLPKCSSKGVVHPISPKVWEKRQLVSKEWNNSLQHENCWFAWLFSKLPTYTWHIPLKLATYETFKNSGRIIIPGVFPSTVSAQLFISSLVTKRFTSYQDSEMSEEIRPCVGWILHRASKKNLNSIAIPVERLLKVLRNLNNTRPKN